MAQTIILLGNPSPQVEHLNQSVTRVEFWDGVHDEDLVEHSLSTDNDRMLSLIAKNASAEQRKYAVALRELEDIIAAEMGGSRPSWVDLVSGDEGLAHAVADYYGAPLGEPKALLTSVGRDAIHQQHAGTSAQPAAFNYIGLTASTTAPAVGDTTLTGEITTAGGGLLRAQATFAHTVGATTSTLTKTFTANGSDVIPVTIAQIGVFNAATGGTLGYHTALAATATLTAPGDSLTITETLTIQ